MSFDEWIVGYFLSGDPYHDMKSSWYAATKAAIPEGYVLVPIEPTEAMFKAGATRNEDGTIDSDLYDLNKIVIKRIYNDMITAAQDKKLLPQSQGGE